MMTGGFGEIPGRLEVGMGVGLEHLHLAANRHPETAAGVAAAPGHPAGSSPGGGRMQRASS